MINKLIKVSHLKRTAQRVCKKSKLIGTLRTATTLTMNKVEWTLNKHQVMKDYKKMSIIEEEALEDSDSVHRYLSFSFIHFSSFKDSSMSEIAENGNNNVPDLVESMDGSANEEDENLNDDSEEDEIIDNSSNYWIKYEKRLKILEDKVENLNTSLENIEKSMTKNISTILNRLRPKIDQS